MSLILKDLQQNKPEAQASESTTVFTRLRFGLVFVNAISWLARGRSLVNASGYDLLPTNLEKTDLHFS